MPIASANREAKPGRASLRGFLNVGSSGDGRREFGLQLGAAVLAVGMLLVILAGLGYSVPRSFEAIWRGSLATDHGIATTLNESVPVIVTGVAAWFAYKAGIFNIGLDGQLQVGGIATFIVVSQLPGVPGVLLIVLALAVGALAGAGWALIAGWLKTARGASEVISTIMLNFIAISLGTRLISGSLRDPDATSPQSASIPSSTEMGRIVSSVPVGWTFVISVTMVISMVVVMQHTRTGLKLRAIGLNTEAAKRTGTHVNRLQLLTFAISGAAVGLAGGMVVLGLRHLLAPGWAPAWGFRGILVAFLAIRVPALIPVWGLIFAILATSGPSLKATASVPDGIVTIMQVLPVIALFALYQIVGRPDQGGIRRWWPGSSRR